MVQGGYGQLGSSAARRCLPRSIVDPANHFAYAGLPVCRAPALLSSVAAEVEALGAKALASQCDLRDESAIAKTVEDTMSKFGRVDILVNNASALWWQDITDTPLKKYDLIHSINARGAFAMTQVQRARLRSCSAVACQRHASRWFLPPAAAVDELSPRAPVPA